MHWELSDEQELFSKSLREWIAAKFDTDAVRALHSSLDGRPFTAALTQEGWWGVGYPEESGGQGGGILELALASREFGRAAVPSSAWSAAALVAPLLTDVELEAQLTGESTVVAAFRADRVPQFVSLDESDGMVSGTVPHVLGASEASTFLVAVGQGDSRRIGRVSAADARSTPDDLLDRSRGTSTVEFSGAPVVDLTDPGSAAMNRTRDLAAVLTAADSLGCAERMLELAVQYSKQRKQFGQFIGAFQAVKHAAAQMLVTVEASYSTALYAAAALQEQSSDASTVAAVAKAQVTAGAAILADSALTVHGAIGYTWEHDLHLFYKRAKLSRSLFGAPSVWNERIAAAVLDRV
jgi:alkylation response protein AidB-like acyl-CoA dehydrogenase